jgi:hypothetical protein
MALFPLACDKNLSENIVFILFLGFQIGQSFKDPLSQSTDSDEYVYE